MTISSDTLVDADDYDESVYALLHSVVDRIIELGAQQDVSDEPDDPEDLEAMAKSQANFTPAEASEQALSGMLLNCLLGLAIARRAALFTLSPEDYHLIPNQTPSDSKPDDSQAK